VAWAVKHKVLASDQRSVIEQGMEMGRPSFLHVAATLQGDTVVNVRVGGECVEISRGQVFI
jgi:trans-2,3-dihydro-3-hydroxyanthranilate isomerase